MSASAVAVPRRSENRRRRGIGLAGILLGIGLGGFAVGIVSHLLLRWHHVFSNGYSGMGTTIPSDTTATGLQDNLLWDGVAFSAYLIASLAGLVLLYSAIRKDRGFKYHWRELAGWMLVGWGGFMLIEGVLAHHILDTHNVRQDVADPNLYNYGFLVAGAVLLVVGLLLAISGNRVSRHESEPVGTAPAATAPAGSATPPSQIDLREQERQRAEATSSAGRHESPPPPPNPGQR